MEKINGLLTSRPPIQVTTKPFHDLLLMTEAAVKLAEAVLDARNRLVKAEFYEKGVRKICVAVKMNGEVHLKETKKDCPATSVKTLTAPKDVKFLQSVVAEKATPLKGGLWARSIEPASPHAFPIIHIGGSRKAVKRELIAEVGIRWIDRFAQTKPRNRRPPAIIFDIDDTLVDYQENRRSGFERMTDLFKYARQSGVRLYVVSARPESTRGRVISLLTDIGCGVDSVNLKLMTDEAYKDGTMDDVVEFKDSSYEGIARVSNVIARFGDKLWDIARPADVQAHFAHFSEKSCLVFLDKNHLCAKLPGN